LDELLWKTICKVNIYHVSADIRMPLFFKKAATNGRLFKYLKGWIEFFKSDDFQA
jgi:hypothetical protein